MQDTRFIVTLRRGGAEHVEFFSTKELAMEFANEHLRYGYWMKYEITIG